ncbi:MAG: hypothetical protein ACXWP6_08295 [Ktedonobacterales bacterium]
MTLTLSRAEARRFLANYHFTPTDVPGVFHRLGTVQYDPLNPVGRNPDLVLQARVPGYQVDDWQKTAYTDRMIYDAWDKMACLVPMSDWPMRARLRARTFNLTPRLLEEQADAVAAALAELDTRGPLSSLEFADQAHFTDRSVWYGPKRIKHILRALWDRGQIVTHHRQGGRHYYDRAERVIPRNTSTRLQWRMRTSRHAGCWPAAARPWASSVLLGTPASGSAVARLPGVRRCSRNWWRRAR